MKNNKLLIIAICCLVIGLCIFGFITLKGNDNDDNNGKNSPDNNVMTQEEAMKDYESRINDPNAYENGAMGYGFIIR